MSNFIGANILSMKEMFENCLKYGYDALIIKCADLLDNINYVPYADLEMQKILIKSGKIIMLENII